MDEKYREKYAVKKKKKTFPKEQFQKENMHRQNRQKI